MKRALSFLLLVACSTNNDKPNDAGADQTMTVDPCAAPCATYTNTCSGDLDACTNACKSGMVSDRDGGPIKRDVRSCLIAAKDDCTSLAHCFDPPPAVPFNTGPYGTKPKDIAGPFTFETWDFQKEWTGLDSYVFLIFAPKQITYPNGADYSADLFKQNVATMLAKSPPNVHYFFLPLKTDDPDWPAARDKWIGQVPAEWTARVHFSDTGAMDQPGWIGQMITYRYKTSLPYKQYDYVGFAIDRFQRIREVGMLGTIVQNGITAKLVNLAYEPTYYEFEWAREQALDKQANVVTLIDKKVVYDTQDIDVTLPDPSMYDTLEVDLSNDCDNHRDGECGAWDYLSYLWICTPNNNADGGDPWKCDTEFARWITAYWRETRWVTDISQMLPLLKQGKQHLRWNANGQWDPRKTNYTVSLSLRYGNKNKGMKPVSAVPLWTGGNWNATYDMNHAPVQLTVDANAKKVELYTLVTGHGASNGNCAEFCNHEHHFTVNGTDHLKSFPGAQSPNGCADMTKLGVVPNQHGTWYFGRGGWCPGYDVAPYVVDVTKEVKLGQMNDLKYTTSFGGQPVDIDRGYVVLSSYLITWK